MVVKKERVTDENKTWGFIGSIPLIGFIIVLLAKKEDKYAMYYAKHGLIIFIVGVILNLIGKIGLDLFWYIAVLGEITLVILLVMLIIAAFSGEQKKFLVLTDLANKIKI
ncbi:MAG: hypothetical protein Q8R18_02125 [bacterium]|nr:hypothetical protein [bacterium]